MKFNLSLYWSKSPEKDKLSVVGVLGSSSIDIKFKAISKNELLENGLNNFINSGKKAINDTKELHKYLERNSNWMSFGVGKMFKVESSDLLSAIDSGIEMYKNGKIQ